MQILRTPRSHSVAGAAPGEGTGLSRVDRNQFRAQRWEFLGGDGMSPRETGQRVLREGHMALLSPRRRTATGLRLTLAIILGVPLTAGAARGQAIDEYQFKAAFLYNLAKFVEWPPETFKNPTAPIVSCILGGGPLGGVLEHATNGNAIEDRKFVVRHISNARQASDCQILFVTSSEQRRWRSIAGDIENSSILTVGETDGFASEGGVVNFKMEGDRIRIQINVDTAERKRLRISAKLLSLSQIVKR